jgi:DNA-binding transcriptional MocR family regulator
MSDDNRTETVIKALRGRLAGSAPGARLPPVRQWVAKLHASPVTVQRALTQLVREGLVVTRPGYGTFVAEAPPEVAAGDLGWQSVALGRAGVRADALLNLVDAPAGRGVIASSGYPDPALHPTALLAGVMGRAARRPGVWDRTPLDGLPELRAWFARDIGGDVRAHDVMVTSGGQPALATTFRALIAPGDPVVVESPTYVGAVVAARAAGARVVPVPTDGEGVRPELLERALRASGARVFYCQPTYANPSGAVLSAPRRRAVLEVVRAAGAFLIEDDWARHLALGAAPPEPLFVHDHDGHVIYIGSLTKCVAPSFRIGVLAARGAAAARLRNARVIDEFFIAGPLQAAALDLVSSPAWPRHLRALRLALRQRRDALVAAVRRLLPEVGLACVPEGGLHLWLALPDTVDDLALARQALAEGLIVSPGAPWFPAEAPGPFLRLSFGGAPPPVLVAATRVLARLLRAGVEGRST